jgi:hypothetical protein
VELKIVAGAGLIAGLIAIAALWAVAASPRDPITHAGFWFDQVAYASPVLGGALTADDLAAIETVARHELATAFAGLTISITDRRDTRYHVRVAQDVPGPPLTRKTWVAGSSHAVPGFGGSGAVNFTYFASGALVFAPPQATRAELIEAIGRGIGRGAAHEFAHQFLSGEALHNTHDRGSYEYHAASRPEQYYGPMHWDVAGPLLAKRFGPVTK